jgi:hypothetical protein
MLELGLSGSVRGVPSNAHPYRDPRPEAAVRRPRDIGRRPVIRKRHSDHIGGDAAGRSHSSGTPALRKPTKYVVSNRARMVSGCEDGLSAAIFAMLE